MSQQREEAECIDCGACPRCEKRERQRAEHAAKMKCVECRDDIYEDFQVSSATWKASGLEPRGGRLHLACLEKRIGRALRLEDFPDQPINRLLFVGFALGREVPDWKKIGFQTRRPTCGTTC